MDKTNRSTKQFAIISVLVLLMGLMVTAGCGFKTDNATQGSGACQTPTSGGQRPEDLDKLYTTNNCVSCDLSNWQIIQLDLSNSDLANANLTNTSLTRSNLTSANLTGANLTNANLSATVLANTILVNANLTGANLTGANLMGANLTGANLTNVNLSNANLMGANLSGAMWVDGSTCGLSSNNGRCEPK